MLCLQAADLVCSSLMNGFRLFNSHSFENAFTFFAEGASIEALSSIAWSKFLSFHLKQKNQRYVSKNFFKFGLSKSLKLLILSHFDEFKWRIYLKSLVFETTWMFIPLKRCWFVVISLRIFLKVQV